MRRYVVDINGCYYDSYSEITDFVTIHLDVLATDIQQYEYEVILAIL